MVILSFAKNWVLKYGPCNSLHDIGILKLIFYTGFFQSFEYRIEQSDQLYLYILRLDSIRNNSSFNGVNNYDLSNVLS